jgi:hypothetical protein
MFAPFLGHNKLEKYISGRAVGMDLRSIMLYLQMKGVKRRAIDDHVLTTLHGEALRYSTVTLWRRQERLTRFSEPSQNLAENSQVTETDQTILSA